MDEEILAELRSMNEKLGKLEKGQRAMHRDIADIKKYLELGIEEDLSRIRDRLSVLEKKVM